MDGGSLIDDRDEGDVLPERDERDERDDRDDIDEPAELGGLLEYEYDG